MTDLPKNLYTAKKVARLDKIAIEERGILGFDLMTKAASSALNIIDINYKDLKKICIFTGSGNNGGDGFVLATLLKARDEDVDLEIVFLGDKDNLKGDAKLAYEKASAANIIIKSMHHEYNLQADLVVDAMLGTGLNSPLSDDYALAVHKINGSGAKVLAIDIPTGLNADTGAIMGSCVKADSTITFIGLKQGLFTGDGVDVRGNLYFSDLLVPRDIYNEVTPSSFRLRISEELIHIASRNTSDHKGKFGYVLIVGGDYGMAGAVTMSAEACLSVGAGLVSVATRPEHAFALGPSIPEVMSHPINEVNDIDKLLAKASVVVIGPGLGQSEWAISLLDKVLAKDLPLVVDADALNIIATRAESQNIKRDNWILTPHPGEAGRLLGISALEVQKNRFLALEELHKKFGGVIVLKGPGTLITDGSKIYLCDKGNPAMATAGMGDILSGVISGLLAQHLSLIDAANLGVISHAVAGDMAANNNQRGLLATNLLPYLKDILNKTS